MFSSRALRRMASAFAITVVVGATFLLVRAPAYAMSVNPILVDLDDSGSTSGQISVTNTLQTPLPVELRVERVVLDEEGKQTVTPAGGEFVIFPPQAMIPPGGTQVFRVQWAGATALTQSQSYLFTVSQLPVELPEGVSGIQLLYDFQVVLNVRPAAAQPSISLTGTAIGRNDKGEPVPVIELANAGAAHGYLSAGRLALEEVDPKGAVVWSKMLEPQEIGQQIGIGLVQPLKSRRFTLPFVLPSASGQIRASFEYIGR